MNTDIKGLKSFYPRSSAFICGQLSYLFKFDNPENIWSNSTSTVTDKNYAKQGTQT